MRILSLPRGIAVTYVLVTSTALADELVAEVRTSAWYERVGIGLSLGGGVDDFVGEELRDMTSLGGSWNLRATLGTRSLLAGEVSYIGTAQSIAAPGFDDDAVLAGNGVQAALRLDVLSTHDIR